jgi:hypothetical protein
MVYGGEDLRTRKCALHRGEWSGCHPQMCPAGCNYGINLTGWLPNDHVEAWAPLDEDPQLAALGEAVRETWSADHLSVYADRLLSLGDPRGELITLELAKGNDPTAAQQARFETLVAECFGDLRSTATDEFRSTRGVGHRAEIELGFISLDAREAHDLRKLYNARNGRYLRKLAIRADGPVCRDTLAMTSLRPHVWLERITVHQHPPSRYDYTLERDTAAALFAAAPNLENLTVIGTRVISVEDVPVRTMWISELDSVVFDRAPALKRIVIAKDRIENLETILDGFIRRAPLLEAIHVPAAAVAGVDLSAFPKVRADVDG